MTTSYKFPHQHDTSNDKRLDCKVVLILSREIGTNSSVLIFEKFPDCMCIGAINPILSAVHFPLTGYTVLNACVFRRRDLQQYVVRIRPDY